MMVQDTQHSPLASVCIHVCTHLHIHIPHTLSTYTQKLGVVFRPREMVSMESWAALGDGLNADKVNAVISHQVANYGMGGQYEPHFDFSRVSPPSLVVLKGSALAGLMSVELLEAF